MAYRNSVMLSYARVIVYTLGLCSLVLFLQVWYFNRGLEVVASAGDPI